MKYKMTIKYLNIINYPYMEEYLENMAREGWLLNKIIGGAIFIFKKIQPQELEFTISPYEMETFLTRKTKEELEEFETVCEAVGWNYCAKSYDLFIYYKDKAADALEIHTDEEEEFKLLERTGKKQIKSLYFLMAILLLSTWRSSRSINTVFFLNSGISQISAPLLPIGLILGIIELIQTRKFLKLNRNNIDLGNPIEYKNSKFSPISLGLTIIFASVILVIIYIFYTYAVLKNKMILRAFLPLIVGLLIGYLYRITIKPTKYSTKSKIILLIVFIIGAGIIGSIMDIFKIDSLGANNDKLNRYKYKILLNSDFANETLEEEGRLTQDISLLVPVYYEYSSRNLEDYEMESIKTYYSKALNETIAHMLFNAHIKETKKSIEMINSRGLKYPFETGEYEPYLSITKEDFEELKDKDIKFAIEESIRRIIERRIVEADNTLWNVDEAYYLRDDKTKIILRKGKEVFVLSGKDFDNEEVVKISKEKLELE